MIRKTKPEALDDDDELAGAREFRPERLGSSPVRRDANALFRSIERGSIITYGALRAGFR
jgi:hypothetical protein